VGDQNLQQREKGAPRRKDRVRTLQDRKQFPTILLRQFVWRLETVRGRQHDYLRPDYKQKSGRPKKDDHSCVGKLF
jgi:hypothetical protein